MMRRRARRPRALARQAWQVRQLRQLRQVRQLRHSKEATVNDSLRPDFSATRGLIEQWTRDGTLPAAAVLVQRGGERLFEHAAGCARREPREPAALDAIWGVASVSKPVAAAVVMHLVDAGKIGLDQRVAEILPEFGPDRERILVRHLLNHSSGMSDEWPKPEEVRAQGPTAALARVRMLFEPGSACTYSTNGFSLLAPLVEQVAGISFDRYVEERVFAPLGMRDSSFDPPASWGARIPDVYDAPGGTGEVWSFFSPRRVPFGPGGGLFSSLRDLASFGQVFVEGGKGLLSAESCRAMTTLQTSGLCTPEGHPQTWGLGWYLHCGDPPANGFAGMLSRRALAHGGATGTWIAVDPEQELVLVLLANQLGLDLARGGAMQVQLVRSVVEALRAAPSARSFAGASGGEDEVVHESTERRAGDRRIPLRITRPAAGRRGPPVLLLHGLGVSKETHDKEAASLARAGFTAVAVDAPHHGERRTRLLDEMHDATGSAAHAILLRMVRDAAEEMPLLVDWLAEEIPGPVGVVGVSMGAYIALAAMAREPRIAAAVSILGSPDWSPRSGEPDNAVRPWLAEAPAHHPERFPPRPVLLGNGGRDVNVPPEGARRFEAALRPLYAQWPERLCYVEYPESDHFMRGEDWDDLWARTLRWFGTYLRAG